MRANSNHSLLHSTQAAPAPFAHAPLPTLALPPLPPSYITPPPLLTRLPPPLPPQGYEYAMFAPQLNDTQFRFAASHPAPPKPPQAVTADIHVPYANGAAGGRAHAQRTQHTAHAARAVLLANSSQPRLIMQLADCRLHALVLQPPH